MSNAITIELCAEDRARIDKLTDALTALASAKAEAVEALHHDSKNDDINGMLKKMLNTPPVEPAKTAQDEPKATDHPTLDPFPETPTEAKPAPTESVKGVSPAEFQQLAIALCRQKKQPEIKKVLDEYGVQRVSDVPEDKRSEVYAKLKALEG